MLCSDEIFCWRDFKCWMQLINKGRSELAISGTTRSCLLACLLYLIWIAFKVLVSDVYSTCSSVDIRGGWHCPVTFSASWLGASITELTEGKLLLSFKVPDLVNWAQNSNRQQSRPGWTEGSSDSEKSEHWTVTTRLYSPVHRSSQIEMLRLPQHRQIIITLLTLNPLSLKDNIL